MRDWRPVSFCLFAAGMFAVSYYFPSVLDDNGNRFLKDFLDNDILSVLGVITALANASILSIFLHLNHLDDEVNFKGKRVRQSLKLSGLSLIFVFLIAFSVVVLKAVVWQEPRIIAFFNSLGVLCVIFSLSVLWEITLTVVKIPSKRAIRKRQEENRRRAKGG